MTVRATQIRHLRTALLDEVVGNLAKMPKCKSNMETSEVPTGRQGPDGQAPKAQTWHSRRVCCILVGDDGKVAFRAALQEQRNTDTDALGPDGRL